MEEGKRKPKLRPHDDEDDWDWRKYQNQKKEDDLDNVPDELPKEQGDQNAQTEGKQEQTES